MDYDSNVCYGYDYHRLVSASDIGEDPDLTRIPWTTFFAATLPGGPLENCVLAPVASVEDLNEIKAAAGQEPFTFVGVRKSIEKVLKDSVEGTAPFRNNWKNLDDTRVPKFKVWKNDQPDNAQGAEIYAVFVSGIGKLVDVENYRPQGKNSDKVYNKAVMKCCGKGYIPKTFCSAPTPSPAP